MSKTLFTNLEEIGAKLIDNTQLRNVRIITYYEALQDIDPAMLFAEKRVIIAEKFGLSEKTVEGILSQYVMKKT